MKKIIKKIKKHRKLILVILVLGLLFAGSKVYQKYKEANSDKKYEIVKLEKRDLRKEISIDGNVVADYEVDLASEVPGIISKVYVKEGQYVKRGQLLMKLKDSDYRSQISSAYVNQKINEVAYEKTKNPNQNLGLEKEIAQDSKEIISQNIEKTKTDIKLQIDSLGIYLSQLLRMEIDDYFDHTEFDDGLYSPTFTYRVKSQIEINRLEEERKKLGSDFQKWREGEKSLENSIAMVGEFENMVFDLYKNSQDFLGFSNRELEAKEKHLSALKNQVSLKKNSLTSLKTALANLQKQLDSSSKTEKKIGNIVNPADLKLAQERIKQARVQTHSAYLQLQKTYIRATKSGIVARVYKEAGEYAGPSAPLVKVVSKNKYVKALLPEVDLAKVKVGQEVEMAFDAYGEKRFKGKVSLIYPEQKEIQGIVYYELKIILDSKEVKDLNILSGMSVEVFIKYEEKKEVPALSRDVVKKENGGKYFVNILNKEKDGIFESKFIKKYFEAGFVGDNFVEVKNGVDGEDDVLKFKK